MDEKQPYKKVPSDHKLIIEKTEIDECFTSYDLSFTYGKPEAHEITNPSEMVFIALRDDKTVSPTCKKCGVAFGMYCGSCTRKRLERLEKEIEELKKLIVPPTN